jgi:hypothetical protein
MGTFPLSSEVPISGSDGEDAAGTVTRPASPAFLTAGDGEDAAATDYHPRVCSNSFGSSLATSMPRMASPKSSQHSATTAGSL